MGSVGNVYRQEVTTVLLRSLRALTFVGWGFPVGGDKVTTHTHTPGGAAVPGVCLYSTVHVQYRGRCTDALRGAIRPMAH